MARRYGGEQAGAQPLRKKEESKRNDTGAEPKSPKTWAHQRSNLQKPTTRSFQAPSDKETSEMCSELRIMQGTACVPGDRALGAGSVLDTTG